MTKPQDTQKRDRPKKKRSPSTRSKDFAAWRGRFSRLFRSQIPVLIAIISAAAITRTEGYTSEAYSIVVLLLLTAVIYTALYSGIRQGIISAIISASYNAYLLSGSIAVVSLSDRSARSALLIAVVLPSLAAIVGHLKERNDYFLAREKHARIQAERSEERLRFMAEAMPQKIFTARPNGDSDYFNPQWTEYTGLSFKQIKSGSWAQFIHPDDLDDNFRRWQHSLGTGEPFQFEHRLKQHDGTYRWHISRAEALRDKEGTVILWVGSSTDIEDVRRTRKLEASTARLIEQRAHLLALNKAKDEFISLASHQLRTPATGVKQYVGMLLEGYAGQTSKQQQQMLRHAYESNERQLAIVDDLLKVAQLDAGRVRLQREKANITNLLKDILQEQASKFTERKQTVVFTPGRRAITASVDSDRMRMVLENIIDNAGKYTPPHKKIEIKAQKAQGLVTITVKDEGVGIARKDRRKIFHKFSRLDNPLSVSVEGSGLGLYWVKKIIDLHGGSIKVDSEVDSGSVFTVSLPADT